MTTKSKTNSNRQVREMKGEFKETRNFLRMCMAGVIQGTINHQQASDVAMLANQQNYNLVVESKMFPPEARAIANQDILNSANALIDASKCDDAPLH